MNTEIADIIKSNYAAIHEKAMKAAVDCGRSSESVKIIAVSKTHPAEIIKAAISAGITRFGENYAQEFRDKAAALKLSEARNYEWHFIGHLQSNKVKYITDEVKMIHTVDSISLAEEIDSRSKKSSKIQDILIQINTSAEEQKSGIAPEEATEICGKILELNNLNLKGLMTIGTYTDDENVSRKESRLLARTKEAIENVYKDIKLIELSMGMSHDFEVAVQEGATMIRIGTAIFGNRIYGKK